MLHKAIAALIVAICIFPVAHAIELGNESTADKADRFDFEEFHKEKGIPLWEGKKEKTVAPSKEPTAKVDPATSFDKGQVLKVRAPYKLGNDPSLRNIQSLFEAIEALHRQLNSHCPRGWVKDREWYQPEDAQWYIYYQAVCL